MTTQFSTLVYTKSPNTPRRRTTFQDELQAAVSARASRNKTDRCSYSDDFDEDEDDFLNELLKSRRKKKRAGATKAANGEPQIINDFKISDDEGQPGRAKRVSFVKTQKIVSPSDGDASGPSAGPRSNADDSSSSRHSVVSADPRVATGSSSKSLSYHTSDDSLLDGPLPLPSDNSVAETPGPEDQGNPVPEDQGNLVPEDSSHAPRVPADTNREPPRPKPRQRTLGLSLRAAERTAEDAASPDLSRPRTSSASIPLSSDASSNIAWTEGSPAVSCGLSKSPSSRSEQSQLLTKTTVDSGSRDGFISGDSQEQGRKYSTSFEEFTADSGGHSQQLSSVHQRSSDSRTSSSQTTRRSHSVCSGKVESRYLGTLQLLDRKVPPQESQPPAADSLRAAVYQEWLRKKKEKSRENMQIKKKEEGTLREKMKRQEEAKKEDSVSSYEAWKEKKAETLKARAKEKQDALRKVQRATEESEEKKHSAKQVFEQWKREHDHLLKAKARRQREAENKLRFSKQEKEEERKRGSTSAFSDWSEKKTVVLHEKVSTEREEIQNKVEEERYMKEERDKMSLEMYESWLVRKDLEQKRQREERRIQAILQDGPPPPWSPPNKTIPFRK
ncbi:microtubule-associated protein 9 [Cyclopterus lumpus]|uniref:microtubule-associated protein 9 n=1 Tax=Cyclopterus lumpus TaxID=8103 RepID=UPI0014871850|nr:microtubule-associated protein 9 [Cyclopterus lumpus]